MGWLKHATGEVSDSPYPSSTRQPNASSKPFITSTGIAAPPEMHTRKAGKSLLSSPVWASNATYMVGTPARTVTPWRASNASASRGSKRGSKRHAGTGGDRRVQRAGLAEGVEQRQPTEDHVVRGELREIGDDDLGVADQVGVGEFGALRVASGARRVEDDGGIVGLPLDQFRRRSSRCEQRRERLGIDDDRLRAGFVGTRLRLAERRVPREDRFGAGVSPGSRLTSRVLRSGFIGTTIAPARRIP